MPWIPQSGIVDAPPESDGVNLLQNRNENALGPFDGRAAAHIWVASNRCFITTNARYVPAPAPGVAGELLLRRDMRWGTDDPTLWPHEYNDGFAHFGAIPRRPFTEKSKETLGTKGALWGAAESPPVGGIAARPLGASHKKRRKRKSKKGEEERGAAAMATATAKAKAKATAKATATATAIDKGDGDNDGEERDG
ncbi:hypothetical protein B0H19DRAFT_1274972 [Mycena capillaripes]|nr:hypothetical protein B0H19DRAFT_1274972 [Mycena capillaripes]